MKTISLIGLVVLAATALKAQTLSPSSDSVRWVVSGFHNTLNNEDVHLACEFDSRPDSIIWAQEEGGYITRFSVNSVEGSWANAAQDGSILYNVNLNSITGTLLFKRENGQVKIAMSLLKDGSNVTPFEFTVSNVSKTPTP